ncbi:MAG: hypothetical protein U1C72_02245 [Candidatus Pacearchaeota archaeon]|nr:hypothetical protein [Candidatus Pacearchaeota archaeon]
MVPRTSVSFFCRECGFDQDIPAFKFSLKTGEEFFEARCKTEGCGKAVRRYVTEVRKDPYYHLSPKMREERARMARDLIQPGQYGFETLYRKQWLDIERKREEYENKAKRYKEQRDEFVKEMKGYTSKQRVAAQAVLTKEEEAGYGVI